MFKIKKGFSLIEILLALGVIAAMSVGVFAIYKSVITRTATQQAFDDIKLVLMLQNTDGNSTYNVKTAARGICAKLRDIPEYQRDWEDFNNGCSFYYKNSGGTFSVTKAISGVNGDTVTVNFAAGKGYNPVDSKKLQTNINVPSLIMRLEKLDGVTTSWNPDRPWLQVKINGGK